MIGSARESKFIAIVATINPDFHNQVLRTGSFKLYLSIRFIIATPFKTYRYNFTLQKAPKNCIKTRYFHS